MGGRDYPVEGWPDTPTTADRSEWDDLPGWAQRALAAHGIFGAPTDPPAEKQTWEQLMEVDASVAAAAERARNRTKPEGAVPAASYQKLRSDRDAWMERATAAERTLKERGTVSVPEDDPDEAEYQRGYDDGWDAGRTAATNEGFSDAWDSGWRACQIWLIQERRRKKHRRAGLDDDGRCGNTGAEKSGNCPCLDDDMKHIKWPPKPPTEEMRMMCSYCGSAKNYWKVETLLYENVWFCYYCEQVTDPKPV